MLAEDRLNAGDTPGPSTRTTATLEENLFGKEQDRLQLSPDQTRGHLDILPSKLAMSPGSHDRRNFFGRSFSKMGKGSLRGSIFSLSACAIGAGVLSLPYVLALTGWVLGLSLIFIGAIAAIWSNQILARLACDHDLKNLSSLTEKGGGKCLSNFLSFLLLMGLFGACLSFQIIIIKLFLYVCPQLGMDSKTADSEILNIGFTVGLAVLILFPLSMKRDMSDFRYVSLASIGALLYTGVVLICEIPEYYDHFKPKVALPIAYFDLNIFTGSAMTFFAYTCQIQLLPIYSELVRPSYPRMVKVINRSIILDFVFYAWIALAGYFSQFDKTNPIVLEREPIPGQGTDYAILIAVISIMICITITYVVNFNPWRQTFFTIVLGRDQFTQTENFAITLSFITLTSIISIVFPQITTIFSILGGLVSVSICYLIPLICHISLSDQNWYHIKNLLPLLFFGTLIIVGYTSLVLTVYMIVKGIDMFPR